MSDAFGDFLGGVTEAAGKAAKGDLDGAAETASETAADAAEAAAEAAGDAAEVVNDVVTDALDADGDGDVDLDDAPLEPEYSYKLGSDPYYAELRLEADLDPRDGDLGAVADLSGYIPDDLDVTLAHAEGGVDVDSSDGEVGASANYEYIGTEYEAEARVDVDGSDGQIGASGTVDRPNMGRTQGGVVIPTAKADESPGETAPRTEPARVVDEDDQAARELQNDDTSGSGSQTSSDKRAERSDEHTGHESVDLAVDTPDRPPDHLREAPSERPVVADGDRPEAVHEVERDLRRELADESRDARSHSFLEEPVTEAAETPLDATADRFIDDRAKAFDSTVDRVVEDQKQAVDDSRQMDERVEDRAVADADQRDLDAGPIDVAPAPGGPGPDIPVPYPDTEVDTDSVADATNDAGTAASDLAAESSQAAADAFSETQDLAEDLGDIGSDLGAAGSEAAEDLGVLGGEWLAPGAPGESIVTEVAEVPAPPVPSVPIPVPNVAGGIEVAEDLGDIGSNLGDAGGQAVADTADAFGIGDFSVDTEFGMFDGTEADPHLNDPFGTGGTDGTGAPGNTDHGDLGSGFDPDGDGDTDFDDIEDVQDDIEEEAEDLVDDIVDSADSDGDGDVDADDAEDWIEDTTGVEVDLNPFD